MTAATDRDVAECRKWAAYYRAIGMNPLPSRMDDKRPCIKFAHLWETQLPAEEFNRWHTANLQVMTGRRWGLMVIDLDGAEAIERWKSMVGGFGTWTTWTSEGQGRHLWFKVDRHGPPIRKTVIWKGEGDHSAIECLGDKALVMAPPSIHPKTGRRYRWFEKRNAPGFGGRSYPAPCPSWLFDLIPTKPEPAYAPELVRPTVRGPMPTGISELIERVDVPSLVRSWGMRTVGRPRESGWLPCHAVGRVDEKPSAAIHSRAGVYVDSGTGLRMGLLDLGVAMGVYRDRGEAVADLRRRYG